MNGIENIFSFEPINIFHSRVLSMLYLPPDYFYEGVNEIIARENSMDGTGCYFIDMLNHKLIVSMGYTDMDESDLIYSAIIEYYSFFCQIFDKKTRGSSKEQRAVKAELFNIKLPLNTIAKAYAKAHEGNMSSVASSVQQRAKEIKDSNYDLYYYLKPIINDKSKTHTGTIPKIDANIAFSSIYNYNISPFNPNSYKSYSFEQFKELKNKFDLENNIDAFLFERMYHYRLIEYIILFCNEYNMLLENITVKFVKDKGECVDLELNTEVMPTTFDQSDAIKNLHDFMVNDPLLRSFTQVKRQFKTSCRVFASELCKFALIPNVFFREKLIKKFIRENVKYVNLPQTELSEKIEPLVSFNARSSAISCEMFHSIFITYAAFKHSIDSYSNKEMTEEVDSAQILWHLLGDKKTYNKLIRDNIKTLGEYIDDFHFPNENLNVEKDSMGICTLLVQEIFFRKRIGYLTGELNHQIFNSDEKWDISSYISTKMHSSFKDLPGASRISCYSDVTPYEAATT